MSGYSYKDFKHELKNVGFVLLVLWVVLSAIGLVYPVAWSFLFAIMLGFVIFDATFGLFFRKIVISVMGRIRMRGKPICGSIEKTAYSIQSTAIHRSFPGISKRASCIAGSPPAIATS